MTLCSTGDLISHTLRNIADLLRMPYGCGEQIMLNFAPNIYILRYLQSSGQLTPEILARAKTYLDTGEKLSCFVFKQFSHKVAERFWWTEKGAKHLLY